MERCLWCGSENASDGKFCMSCGKPLGSAPIPGKCIRCGAINAIDVTRCTSCGTPLSEFRQGSAPLEKVPGSRDWYARSTSPAKDAFLDSARWRKDTALVVLRQRPSGNLTAAGVLLIIAGLLTLFQGLIMFGMESYFVEEEVIDSGFLACCGTLEILFGLGAASGGYFALKGSNYGLVLAGCLCAIAGFGAVAGTILGIVALILVTSRRSEFRR